MVKSGSRAILHHRDSISAWIETFITVLCQQMKVMLPSPICVNRSCAYSRLSERWIWPRDYTSVEPLLSWSLILLLFITVYFTLEKTKEMEVTGTHLHWILVCGWILCSLILHVFSFWFIPTGFEDDHMFIQTWL